MSKSFVFSSAGIAICGLATVFHPAARAQEDLDPEEMQQRIEELEQRVEDLESTAVLSEPETRVRRIEVWVDENGVEYDTEQPGTERVVTYQRERVYRRQTINEKIEEAMDDAASNSVAVGVDAAIVLQHAQQTDGPDAIADGNTYELASADLYFTAGLAQYTMFYADIVGLSGTPPDLEVGGLTLLNGYAARLVNQNELNLREAWIMTELADQRLGLTAGRVDLTNYFDHNAVANDETTQFLSDALVNNPMLGLSENGAGLAAVFDPKNGFTAKLGYQQSSSTATNLSDSLFYLGEVGMLITPFNLGEGTYRAWYRTDNSSGTDQSAYGISADQRLTAALTIFARVGSAQTAGPRDKFHSAGFQLKNGVIVNPEDYWGVGFARTELGAGDEETLVEGYYNLHLTQKLALTFHLTHVTETPAGGEDVTYLVPGVRLQASF
jgi:hypothetical protein